MIGIPIVLFLMGLAYVIADESMPEGREGHAADSLARHVMESVNTAAWKDVRALKWTFAGSNKHLWDRDRNMVRVEFSEHTIYFYTGTREGIALKNGQRVPDAAKEAELVVKGWEYWINDSFWLNPFPKFFDEGVTRSTVSQEDGSDALMIQFASGGVTPGDAYLFILDENGLPEAWKMWVSIIPIGGIETSWEDWVDLSGGARVARLHRSSIFDLEISEVRAAAALSDLLPGGDPFLPLLTKH